MMDICLGNRTAETVKIYFEKASQPEIKAVLPQKAKTVEEALADYRETSRPNANSYGKTIIANGDYIGDIWCYCIDVNKEPNAMLSYCIFEKAYRSQGIATKAISMFLKEIWTKYALNTIGAFTFSDNLASIRVLQKNDFSEIEEFSEDGRNSKYFQYTC
ncbi:MAG: GNAT family N-acetyltransferase [Roseburia sp.]|nr:GNAT family N-acetyltransferase [Roseburia sp.]